MASRTSTATMPSALTAQYDLGGGATVNGGVAYTYGGVGDDGQDQATVADFGIKMAF